MRSWTIEDLKQAVKISDSLTDVLINLGLRPAGGNFESMKKHIKNNDISIKHFTRKNQFNKLKQFKSKPLSEILLEHSKYKNNSRLKKKLIKAGLIENKCKICNLQPIWQGKKLIMQLDHINGVSDDYRLSNLRLLCPNCHSQTKSFCRKNFTNLK